MKMVINIGRKYYAPLVAIFCVLLVVSLLCLSCTDTYKYSKSEGYRTAPEFAKRQMKMAGPYSPFQPYDGQLPVTPLLDEELWVIVKAEGDMPYTPAEDVPGSGELRAKLPDSPKEIPLPLKHTDVKANIAAYIATVNVTQQYHNLYDEKIEAVYVFPLPQNAAVNDFIMTVGERRIRGIIREREEAERIYEEAKYQGYVASLLTQERPNIFTQSVANIEPGKEIDIDITYFHTLRYSKGTYEFVFPMVVGPRFNPPGYSDGVGAVGRGNYGTSGQKTEIQYLKSNELSPHEISLAVDIDAGVSIEEITCTSHVINTTKLADEKVHVELSPNDAIPNKDFVLKYKVAGDQIKTALLTHKDDRGGFFTLLIQPPEDLTMLKRRPQEMIFVLDCSGSMSGKPLDISKKAMERALRRLGPEDSFQIIRFSNNASQLGPKPIPATRANVQKGLRYMRSLNAGGGTMMIEGIKAALDFPHDPNRFRIVTFMTDGYIGNDREILGEVHKRLGASRIFSFGVGSSPNRYLLDRMAHIGRGAVAYVGLDDSAAKVVDTFYERISFPALTDINIDWGEMNVKDVYPHNIPDLFVGRPVIVTGTYSGAGVAAVRISGKTNDETIYTDIPVNLDDPTNVHAGIPSVWARAKIAELEDRATWEGSSELAGQIRNVALEFGLLSEFTAFVAVDTKTQTQGRYGTTVAVPVPVPEGVKYETTVQE